MFTNPTPDDLASRLPAHAYCQLIRTLCLTLPPPLSDSPDDLTRRNHAAIARIAALAPANATEADLAAIFVAASDQWKDCLALVQLPDTTPERATKCRAQSISMMRQAQSALRLLLQLQEAWRKVEADSTACNSAAWSEHCAINLMAEALSPEANPAPIAEPQARPPQPEPQPEPVEELEPDPIAEAEHYAAIYPERAALIRRLRRVPHNATFGPPDDDLVQTLITARTPALVALDHEFAEAGAV